MTDRDYIYICEDCGKLIYVGDKYQPGGECNFCPDHAATLKGCLEFWESDIAEGNQYPCWPEVFDIIEDAHEHIEGLKKQIERDGPDFKKLWVA